MTSEHFPLTNRSLCSLIGLRMFNYWRVLNLGLYFINMLLYCFFLSYCLWVFSLSPDSFPSPCLNGIKLLHPGSSSCHSVREIILQIIFTCSRDQFVYWSSVIHEEKEKHTPPSAGEHHSIHPDVVITWSTSPSVVLIYWSATVLFLSSLLINNLTITDLLIIYYLSILMK